MSGLYIITDSKKYRAACSLPHYMAKSLNMVLIIHHFVRAAAVTEPACMPPWNAVLSWFYKAEYIWRHLESLRSTTLHKLCYYIMEIS